MTKNHLKVLDLQTSSVFWALDSWSNDHPAEFHRGQKFCYCKIFDVNFVSIVKNLFDDEQTETMIGIWEETCCRSSLIGRFDIRELVAFTKCYPHLYIFKPCSHLMSVIESNFKNFFYGIKLWYSYLAFPFVSKDQRKIQTDVKCEQGFS